LALYFSGLSEGETWAQAPQKSALHHVYSTVVALMRQLGVSEFETSPIENSQTYAYGLRISVQKKTCVEFGLIQPDLAAKLDVKQEVFMADLDWDYWAKKEKGNFQYQEISKFPEVRRDLSLVIDRSISYNEIYKLASQTEKQILKMWPYLMSMRART